MNLFSGFRLNTGLNVRFSSDVGKCDLQTGLVIERLFLSLLCLILFVPLQLSVVFRPLQISAHAGMICKGVSMKSWYPFTICNMFGSFVICSQFVRNCANLSPSMAISGC